VQVKTLPLWRLVDAHRPTVRLIVACSVRFPDLPVMVIVTVPVVALRLADKVKVLEPVVGSGLKEAVVPLRMPEADKVTPELNPFAGVMVMVVVPLLLRAMLRLVGDADKLKLGAGVTVSEIVVDVFRLPLTLLMVTVKVPVAAPVPAVSVNVLVLVVLTGLKDAVTPLGRPEADRLTAPLKPFKGAIVMLLVPWLPCAIVSTFGEAESA